MTQTSLTNKVIDKLKILNSGFSMNLTKVENRTVAVEFFAGADSSVIAYKQGLLTGFAPIPPLFTLGYHQCRWNYMT